MSASTLAFERRGWIGKSRRDANSADGKRGVSDLRNARTLREHELFGASLPIGSPRRDVLSADERWRRRASQVTSNKLIYMQLWNASGQKEPGDPNAGKALGQDRLRCPEMRPGGQDVVDNGQDFGGWHRQRVVDFVEFRDLVGRWTLLGLMDGVRAPRLKHEFADVRGRFMRSSCSGSTFAFDGGIGTNVNIFNALALSAVSNASATGRIACSL